MALDRKYAATKGGSVYVATPAATTGSDTAPTKTAGTFAAVAGGKDVTLATTGRITATWKGKRQALVTATGTLTNGDAGLDDFEVSIFKNGAAVTGAKVTSLIQVASTKTPFAVSVSLELDENDYVEVFVENTAAATPAVLTVNSLVLSVVS